MNRTKPGRAQVNLGIQADSVGADVMAVGPGAKAFKASPQLHPEDEAGDDLRILLLASNPQTTSPLGLAEEMRALEIELRGARFRDRIVLTMGHAVRPDDLVRLLRRDRPTIVHFSGHGSPEGIMLGAEFGHVSVSGEVLARLFRDHGIRLVVLNSCFSDSQAIALKDVVSAVIGTTAEFGDDTAIRFTTAFYRTLGDGHSVRDALRDGRDAVAANDLEDVFRAYGDLDHAVQLLDRGSPG